MGKVKNRQLRTLTWIVVIAAALHLIQCGGCEQEKARLVRMTQDTGLYVEASRKSDRLGIVPAGQLVEILGDPLPEEGSERKWYPALWKGKEGFVLIHPDQIEMSTTSADEGEAELTEESEVEMSEGENPFQPKRLKPARFDPEGQSFSLGLGCTGSTHSEYSVSLKFQGDEIRMLESGLMEYGMPGEACGSTYEDEIVGTYKFEKGEIRAFWKKKISRIRTAEFPNCDAIKTEEKKVDVDRKDRFYTLECDGKKALQMDPADAARDSSEDADPAANSYSDQYFVVQ